MSRDIYCDNKLIEIIAKVTGNTNALELLFHRDILKVMVDHHMWKMLNGDPEFKQAMVELEAIRQNYTSVAALRDAYTKVLTCYIQLFLHDHCGCLMYRYNEDGGLAISKTIEIDGDDKLRQVYCIRSVESSEGVDNYEYHDELNFNFFNALCWRLNAGVHARPSPFGYPSAELITQFDPQLVNSNGRIAAGY